MEISETKFESMARSCQRLDTICDYITDRAKSGCNDIGLGVITVMAGIQDDVREAIEREADNHDE